jgi:hypothetical protein
LKNYADEPEEAPETVYDPRSLYERLKEQRDKKDMDFEESKKFKNLVHTLDDDEIIHLNTVDELKLMQEKQQKEEELKEINEYRMKVAELQEISSEQVKLTKIEFFNQSQFNLIFQRLQEIAGSKKSTQVIQKPSLQKSILTSAVKRKSETISMSDISQPSALKCIAILPGISDYKSSDEGSDSDSSDLEDHHLQRDLTGREIKRVKHSEG